MTPSPERRTDPTGKLGLTAQPLKDRVPGTPEGTLLVEVDGKFDRGNDGWAVDLLLRYMKDLDTHGVVFDTWRVESCGDHAIHLFTAALKAVHPRGGTVVVLPSPCIRESLRISRLETLFPPARDPTEAAAILAAAAADRSPGAPAPDLPREEEDGNGNKAVFEPLSDLPGGLVIRYSGYLDRQAGTWFYGLVLRRVEAEFIRLALDFSGLQWPGSGIGHLTGILKTVKLRDGRLVLFGIPPKIDEVFLLLGLFHQYFEIVDTEAEAMALLKRSSDGLEEPEFPKIFKCPICGARTRSARPMRGRCKSCKTLLKVTDEGEVFLG